MSPQAPVAACSSARAGARVAIWILALATAAGASMIGSRLLLKLEPAGVARLAATLLPLPFLGAMIIVITRSMRTLDEMQVRIQFEALSLTVAVSALLVVAWGQLQKAGYVPVDDMAMAYAIISFAYAACYAVAWRRYR